MVEGNGSDLKAVVLAAGEGRRLKPLTNVRPKPMIPVANRPLLEDVVKALSEAGVDDIVLVVGYKKDRIQTYFGDGDDWDVDITYVVQNKQLGTGHAVMQAEKYVEGDFLVLNGDRIVEADSVEQLIQRYLEVEGCVMSVSRSDEPSDYGVVDMEAGKAVDVREKPPEYDTRSDIINAGLYAFNQSVFDYIGRGDVGGEISLTDALRRMMSDIDVNVVRSEGLWIDVSYLWDILTVNSQVIDRTGGSVKGNARIRDGAQVSGRSLVGNDCHVGTNATILPGTSLGENVSVGANAVVSNSVVLPDATIGEGSVVKDTIISGNTHVGPNVTMEGGKSRVIVDDELYQDVRLGGVVGDNTQIGAASVVESGNIIGNDVSIGVGSLVRRNVDPKTRVEHG
ncbi:MAG: sugar phosphate nucleotidyltransferase [Halobacteria archaeon]